MLQPKTWKLSRFNLPLKRDGSHGPSTETNPLVALICHQCRLALQYPMLFENSANFNLKIVPGQAGLELVFGNHGYKAHRQDLLTEES